MHGFCKKSNIFSWVFFGQIKQEKFGFWCSGWKECFSHKESKVSLKTPKNPSVPKRLGHVLVTNSNIFSWVFLGQINQKRSFFYIVHRKEYFLNQKSEVLLKSKKPRFSKLVSPWFSSKIRIFSHGYFLGKLSQKRLFLTFWIEKNAI